MSPTRATPSSRMLSVAAVLALVACGSPATSGTQATAPAAVSKLPQANATIAHPTQQPQPLPLSAIGAYHVGLRTIAAEDPSRKNRRVSITVWYPAERPAAATGNGPTRVAAPDPGGAPYPLILSSAKVARVFAPYLVSRGFAWASVDGLDTYPAMLEHMFRQPLDILFALGGTRTCLPCQTS